MNPRSKKVNMTFYYKTFLKTLKPACHLWWYSCSSDSCRLWCEMIVHLATYFNRWWYFECVWWVEYLSCGSTLHSCSGPTSPWLVTNCHIGRGCYYNVSSKFGWGPFSFCRIPSAYGWRVVPTLSSVWCRYFTSSIPWCSWCSECYPNLADINPLEFLS